jgi:hypothetical protein
MITFKEIKEEIIEEQAQVPGDPNMFRAKGAELFARCRAASTAAHFAHLMTPSYAQHVALNTFYDEIIDLVDAVAEGLIGRYGKFEGFPNVRESSTDGLTIVGNLTKWIEANRAMVSDASEIQNDIDTILSLCNSTAYKLRELK